jgi:hypothetical protein
MSGAMFQFCGKPAGMMAAQHNQPGGEKYHNSIYETI